MKKNELCKEDEEEKIHINLWCSPQRMQGNPIASFALVSDRAVSPNLAPQIVQNLQMSLGITESPLSGCYCQSQVLLVER